MLVPSLLRPRHTSQRWLEPGSPRLASPPASAEAVALKDSELKIRNKRLNPLPPPPALVGATPPCRCLPRAEETPGWRNCQSRPRGRSAADSSSLKYHSRKREEGRAPKNILNDQLELPKHQKPITAREIPAKLAFDFQGNPPPPSFQ